jgi:hypothetical protein
MTVTETEQSLAQLARPRRRGLRPGKIYFAGVKRLIAAMFVIATLLGGATVLGTAVPANASAGDGWFCKIWREGEGCVYWTYCWWDDQGAYGCIGE